MNHKIEINWMELYSQSEQVRRLADKIHSSRMLAPPTCDQCIEMAVKQLKADQLRANIEFGAVFEPKNK